MGCSSLFIAFIRTGAFQVRPAYSSISADVPQGSTVAKSKAKISKVKTISKEIEAPTILVNSSIAQKNQGDSDDSDPVVLKVRWLGLVGTSIQFLKHKQAVFRSAPASLNASHSNYAASSCRPEWKIALVCIFRWIRNVFDWILIVFRWALIMCVIWTNLSCLSAIRAQDCHCSWVQYSQHHNHSL